MFYVMMMMIQSLDSWALEKDYLYISSAVGIPKIPQSWGIRNSLLNPWKTYRGEQFLLPYLVWRNE